jgi:uncharacterized membrane protein YhdT
MTNKDFSYQEALRRSHQEALVTLGAACLITIVFWLGVFAFEGSQIGWFGVPLWFWASCVGGYFFSILIVWILVRFCFKNFSFDPNYEES